jgi:signal transduction histidine kinase
MQAVLEGDLPEELGFIDSSAERMDRLVTAILHLSRLERQELHFERIETGELVSSILQSLAYRLEQHPATVQVGTLPPVTADPMALELVFQNLLSNAVTYLKPRCVGRIEVQGRREQEEIVFEVKDNGRGIAAGARDKVFQVFGRAGDADTEGEGMGLAYVQTLLRRHGGRVWFDTRVGEGTVFSFSLPLRMPT